MHLGVPHNQQYGSVASLGFGEELAGSTLAADWQQYFDEYDPTKEQMYGQQFQTGLGGIFEQAGAGVTSLMESWAGAGQAMSGRKKRQRKAIGEESASAIQQLGQGLAQDVYGARESWEQQQRSNLNTLLGMDIWTGESSGGPYGNPCPQGFATPTLEQAEAGLQGCQPIEGAEGTDPIIHGTNTEEGCLSQGGTWEGGVCSFPSGIGGGGYEGGGDTPPAQCEPPSGGCHVGLVWDENSCACVAG